MFARMAVGPCQRLHMLLQFQFTQRGGQVQPAGEAASRGIPSNRSSTRSTRDGPQHCLSVTRRVITDSPIAFPSAALQRGAVKRFRNR